MYLYRYALILSSFQNITLNKTILKKEHMTNEGEDAHVQTGFSNLFYVLMNTTVNRILIQSNNMQYQIKILKE